MASFKIKLAWVIPATDDTINQKGAQCLVVAIYSEICFVCIDNTLETRKKKWVGGVQECVTFTEERPKKKIRAVFFLQKDYKHNDSMMINFNSESDKSSTDLEVNFISN